jgi:RsiW-degrading membrane proteinase PrsW (M82 family)
VRGVPSVFVVGAFQANLADPVVVTAVTVSVAVPETPPDMAVKTVVPAAIAVALPLEPVALLIAATLVLDELQVTEAVRFCVVPSE